MSAFFDPSHRQTEAATMTQDVLMTNPTALHELESYWASLPRSRGVPMRKDVDPVAMSGLLEDSFILERVAPGVARIRVAGRNIGRLIGVEPRGLPLTAAFLPQARAAMGQHLEAAFTSPALVELALEAPRAVGQPRLDGRILLLPLRDDHGRVSRLLGVLVMSGIRGLGGRRFVVPDKAAVRVEPIVGLHAVQAAPAPLAPVKQQMRSSLALPRNKKAEDMPALRLVVSNS